MESDTSDDTGAYGGVRIKKSPCLSRGMKAYASLLPYLADHSAGVGTLRRVPTNDVVHLGRLPGFIGPIPSTSLDKAAIQLLSLLYGGSILLVKGWTTAGMAILPAG